MKTFAILASTVLASTVLALLLENESAAGAPSKDECIDAHGRGQDLRERGQLVRARQTFLTCAQATCPTLVQGDCAHLGEELAHLVPTVTFGARDNAANDLPSTSVFVDDVLFTSHLDDGKTYEVDPGRHAVRYVHGGKESTLHVILNQGEQGRLLVARFVDVDAQNRETEGVPQGLLSAASTRPKLPLVVAGIGAAAAATGAVILGIGMGNVPSNCSIGSRECTSPRGDPSLGRAHDGLAMANVGLTIGTLGAVTLVTGVLWYFAQPSERARRALTGSSFLQF